MDKDSAEKIGHIVCRAIYHAVEKQAIEQNLIVSQALANADRIAEAGYVAAITALGYPPS